MAQTKYGVAGLDAEAGEQIGKTGGQRLQCQVIELLLHSPLTQPAQGNMGPEAGFYMAIYGLISDVEFAI